MCLNKTKQNKMQQGIVYHIGFYIEVNADDGELKTKI